MNLDSNEDGVTNEGRSCTEAHGVFHYSNDMENKPKWKHFKLKQLQRIYFKSNGFPWDLFTENPFNPYFLQKQPLQHIPSITTYLMYQENYHGKSVLLTLETPLSDLHESRINCWKNWVLGMGNKKEMLK